jgi:hypothetical protein
MSAAGYDSIPISQLPLGAAVLSTDVYPATNTVDYTESPSGTTYKYTVAQLSEYILGLSSGSNIQSAYVATTAPLTATYDNGIANNGIGATLTNAGTIQALVIDGVTLAVGERVLVNNQVAPLQNGVYVVTVAGDVATAWILTRASDYDSSVRNPMQGDFIAIIAGDQNALTFWIETDPNPIVIGTSPIQFSLYSNTNWVSVTGTSQLVQNNVNYIPLNGSLTTFTLPATCPVGFRFNIEGLGAGGWTIQAGGGQYLRFLSTSSSAGGTVSSKLQYDNCAVVCVTANVEFKLMTAGSSSIQFT